MGWALGASWAKAGPTATTRPSATQPIRGTILIEVPLNQEVAELSPHSNYCGDRWL